MKRLTPSVIELTREESDAYGRLLDYLERGKLSIAKAVTKVAEEYPGLGEEFYTWLETQR